MKSIFCTNILIYRWVKRKMLPAFMVLFLFNFNAKANHIDYYGVLQAEVTTIFPQKVITSTASPATSQLYVSVGYGKSITTGFNIITLTKMDFAGNCVYASTFQIPTILNVNLLPKSIAEDFNPANPLGYVIVGDFSNTVTGVFGHFAMKINQACTSVIWTTSWADDLGTKAVIISHDPNNYSHIYVVAQTSAAGTSWPVLYHLNPTTGAIIGTHILKYSSTLISVTVRDAVESNTLAIPPLLGYYLLCDNSNGQAVIAFTPWFNTPLATTNYYTFPNPPGCSNVVMAAVTKHPSLAGPVILESVGSCTVPGLGKRPFMLETQIGAVASFAYLCSPIYCPGMPASDAIQPTSINFVPLQMPSRPVNSVLVAFNHNASGSAVSNSGMFTVNMMNLNVTSANMLYIHLAGSLNSYTYTSSTNTYNSLSYIGLGQGTLTLGGNSYPMMSRMNYDGEFSPNSCHRPYTISGNVTSGTVTTWLTQFPFSKIWGVQHGMITIDPAVKIYIGCGNTPGIGGLPHPGPFAVNYDNTFNTNNIINADYDAANEEAVFATTKLVSSANTMYLNTVNSAAAFNIETMFPNGGQDEALATKKAANGDIIIAGRTSLAGGHVVVFIHRTDEFGTTIWYKYYDQGTTPIGTNINITETTISNDIVVIASSNTGSNDVIMMRTDANGVLEYYDDHAVYAGTNTSETAPYLRGLTATSDDGYAVCGTTGQNGDYLGALVIKCDGGYSGTHTLDWNYVHRHLLSSGYDLTDPGKRSASFANAVIEDASGNLWIAGSTSNCDQNGLNATYQNGLLIELQSNGRLISTNAYADASSSFIAYNGLSMSGSNVMLSGYSQDPSSGATKTTLSQVDASSYAMNWTMEYGSNSINMGTSVFTTSTGYMIVGVSNDNTSTTAPIVMMTDLSGVSGCETAMTLTGATDANDPVSITVGSSTSATENTLAITPSDDNETFTNVCGSSTGGLRPMLTSGINNIKIDAKQSTKSISAYPNPTNGKINIKLNANVNANGVISVSDVQGRVLYTSSVSISNKSNLFEIDMTGFASGVYIMKVTDDKGSVYPLCNINKL